MSASLELTPDQMRELGYRVVDVIVEHLATLKDQPVGAKANPGELLARFSGPAPEQGSDFESVLRQLGEDVFRYTMHVNHPRFFAYVPGPGNFVGAMADALVSGFNVFAGTWISGSGAAAVELETIRWIRDFCGYPDDAGGLFVSGGTMANFTAMVCARHVKLGGRNEGGVVYLTDQTHYTIEKALRAMGFAKEQLCVLASDDSFRMPVQELKRMVAQHRLEGKRPFCVVASAGTTNTGAIDPLLELAPFCRAEDLWLHADGAYGAAAALCERGRIALAGLELTDSLSLDPHKWLFQPFEIGCLLVRHRDDLKDAFQIQPHILKDTHQVSEEINFTDYGLQLTRGFRALKLWMSIKIYGMAAFRAAIERGFELAEFAELKLRELTDWVVETPAQMAVVSFRHAMGDDAFHLRLVQDLLADGTALITSTAARGRTILRMCTINPRTTEQDIDRTLAKLAELARRR